MEILSDKSLDPTDWEKTREIGHKMLDDMINHLKTVRDRPIWKQMPDSVKDELKSGVPSTPTDIGDVYYEFKRNILEYAMGNTHPRFWGWVIGTGTPTGMLADMLASGINSNLGGGNHAGNYVEAQVLDWMKELFNFPPTASGLLVSGGSMANLMGITVARNTKIPNIREKGLKQIEDKYTIYCSVETHSSVQKSVEMLGLGSNSLRKIPVNENFEIEIDDLRSTIEKDINEGYVPFCLIGNAGTVNTGAVDDLGILADIASQNNMWYHIDGAFGALVNLTPKYKHMVKDIDRADSLAFDLHKWMYLPYAIGVILVKEKDAHYNSFTLTPEYLTHGERGVHSGNIWFSDFGVELSRNFKGLKAWMSIKELGIGRFGEAIQMNIDQAKYLGSIIEETEKLELLAPIPMNIVCFRYNDGRDPSKLNELNEEILIQLHERGIAVPSYTTLNGNYAIRMANTNHRSRQEDFDLLVKSILEIGNELSQ